MPDLLKINNLKKYFDTPGGTLHAVDDISFSIKEGDTLGVVGESGCGKSTLGRTILHLQEPTDGKIFYKGEDITNPSRKKLSRLRREMQIIFQDPFSSLNQHMTVFQTISEPLQIIGGYKNKEIQDKVEKMMDTVGLARRFVNSYPHELDGGRRQRIGIARALVLEPRFIVCDEPVSALDVSIQAQILNLMLDIQDEMNLTYIFITHNLAVVRYISDDILVMYLGEMVEKAPAEQLYNKRFHPYTKALLSSILEPKISTGTTRILLKGELTSPINPKEGCRFASRCIYAKEECFQKSPKPEMIEPNHFVKCHRVKEINNL